jgi:hypothetical protein
LKIAQQNQKTRRKQQMPEESVKSKPENPPRRIKKKENAKPKDPVVTGRSPYPSAPGRSVLMRVQADFLYAAFCGTSAKRRVLWPVDFALVFGLWARPIVRFLKQIFSFSFALLSHIFEKRTDYDF